MSRRTWSDSGQTLPIYIWLTGILLFAAFAFFAFAQAASARNGAQSAADAAALAAAQDSRDELIDGLGLVIGDGGDWLDWLAGEGFTGDGAQVAAEQLAADNDSTVLGAVQPRTVNGYPGYRVQIRTRYTVGQSIIPGTESRHAKAEATAVIQPRCEADPDADPKKDVVFHCDGGEDFEIDPGDFTPEDLPAASVLFSVHLAD
ncbi:pilus assembly protein TadG-related protein [Streptomyces sp. NPDC058254]|uniref:pilus assembly protein TadG-related protein n=1 Tax=Streptomyces sp. NPDC058254 TaxID=3346406 RepID=UPI0036EA78C7